MTANLTPSAKKQLRGLCHDAWAAAGKPPRDSDITLVDYPEVTIADCFDYFASYTYTPSLGGNIFFAVVFGVLLLSQIGLGIKYKTWGFMGAMVAGLILEVVGYAARVQEAEDPFNDDPFLTYLICLTIGPVFLAAAIYLAFVRIIMSYGGHLSRLSPRIIAPTLMITDFLTLVLQAVGGAITDTATKQTTKQAGINTMIAGLAMQVVSLTLFLLFVADFVYRVKSRKAERNSEFAYLTSSKTFIAFIASTVLAGVFILIRSVFRVAELSKGFNGDIWNSEVDFMVLDGTMCALAVIVLTICHPGIAYKTYEAYNAAGWRLRKGGKNAPAGLAMEAKGEKHSSKAGWWNRKGGKQGFTQRVDESGQSTPPV